jgi:hypothetical protein
MAGRAVLSPDAFMAGLTHVHAGEVVRLRAVLQGIQSPVLQERLKWNAPSYAVGGVHVVTFNFGAPKSVRLIFHCDTKRKETKGAPPAMVDETGLLARQSDIRAIASLESEADFARARQALPGLVRKWLKEVVCA